MRGAELNGLAGVLGNSLDSSRSVQSLQIDSRKVGVGDLFFALAGETVDGHQFIQDAAERGAIAAVVSKSYAGPSFGLDLIAVDDVFLALRHLAAQDWKSAKTPLLGITGSVGKTTVKEFAATLLEGSFRLFKNPSSYNSQRTFPMNLFNRTGQEELFVLEMGMSEPGEMERLVELAPPDLAIITKVALCHAMNFPEGLPAIAKAKAAIASDPHTKTLIVDAEALKLYPEAFQECKAKKITFSLQDSTADYYLFFAEGAFFIDEEGVRVHQFDLPFRTAPLLHNFLAAAVAARRLGMKWEEIEQRIPLLQLPPMRFEQFEQEGVHFINDAYNANPASMRAALEHLPEPKEGGKRIAVLATMKELGAFSKESHAEIGLIAQKRVDHLLCLGDEEIEPLCESFSHSKKPFECFSSHGPLVEKLREIMRPGDVVLLKGSRSMKLEKVLEGLHAASAR